jgi:transcriptional regulator with XRE-family HTH domain
MTDREIFQKNFQRLLSESGLLQKEVAEKLGVTPATVNVWLHGKAYPRVDVMEKLSIIFGVTLSDIACEPESIDVEDQKLLTMFHSLNSIGKSKLLERAQELCVLYGEKSGTISGQKVV